jgi:hypothetical protein
MGASRVARMWLTIESLPLAVRAWVERLDLKTLLGALGLPAEAGLASGTGVSPVF